LKTESKNVKAVILMVVMYCSDVIPGMNAIAFTREVRALSCAPRRMAARTALNTILRGSPKTASTSG